MIELKPPTVLVVDDEPANRRLLSDLVKREKFRAIEASGGEEALAVIAHEQVDLVLLDLMMPEVDGMAVLWKLQQGGIIPALPVVVVTALQERSMQMEALGAGAVDFLAKPIDRLEVACKVNTLIELKRLREQLVGAVEEKLLEADHLLRLRFEQSPVANVTWDTELRVAAWNPAAERVFGYSAAEAQGKDVTLVMSGIVEQLSRDFWQKSMQGAASEFIHDSVRQDGRVITCEWHVAPLTSADGELLGVSSEIIDITERVRLQNALNQSQKMEAVGQLAGGVAHDFNNLLGVILSYASFIRDELPEGDRSRDDALEVLKAGQRAAGLTRQLLAFSRHDPSRKIPTDLNKSLGQMYQLLARTLGEHIKLNVTPAAQQSIANIDPVQFDQVLLNLAVNARDAMPEGGELSIVLKHPPSHPSGEDGGERVELIVTDTGAGMNAETQRHIFEPFFTTKEKGKGTGLGLATCFGIVSDAGGTISVKSAEGRGTTFTISLPLSDEGTNSSPGAQRISRKGKGELVLVIEDDEALCKVAVRVLASAGYSVHAASNGPDGMRKIEELGTQLCTAIVDCMLPGCSGHEVVAHAERVAPHLNVILMSGLNQELPPRSGGSSVSLLVKPVTPGDLVAAVDASIASASEALPLSVYRRRVLLVGSNETTTGPIQQNLLTLGCSCTVVQSHSEALRVLKVEDEPVLLLCDLTPDNGRAQLLDWIQSNRPLLCPRVLVLADEAPMHDSRPANEGIFRVLPKPVDEGTLRSILGPLPLGLEPVGATASKSNEQPPLPPPTTRREARARVLLIDDDHALARSISRILEAAQFDVITASTVHEARRLLDDTELDLLLTDIDLPDGSGLDLLPELAGRHSELPVVLVTGALSVDSATRALKARVSEFLPKPFTPEQLTTIARQAVDAGRISRLRTKLLAARFGGDEFLRDISATERNFESAIEKIRMVFQPIVRAVDGSVFGYEALLRCEEPSLASPPRLLAAAEVLGRVDEVGIAVRSGVARAMRDEPGRLEAIFVNLHPHEVRADLLSKLSDPLLGLANRVVLEVTERASLEAGAKLDEELSRIRGLGYRLAIDDLGEGYAGLSSLVHLRPDIAKLDMSLIREIHCMPLKRDIVAALMDMARRSGIIVVAEGIETVEERDTLVDLGCDLLQGYLFARPGPPFPEPKTKFGPEA